MANKFDNNANKIAGTTNPDNFNGLGGNDSIFGAGGNDILIGGDGNDTLNGGVDDDILTGDKGTDKLIGDSGKDTLNGGDHNDTLDGGNDNDKLDGGTGADAMTGGNGDDSYWVDNTKDKIVEDEDKGTDTVTSAVNFTLGANLENLTLKPGTTGLKGTGNELKNVITGNNGNNYLDGKGEDDQLIGGGGDDTLDGGAGKDKLTGGDGSDTYMVTNTDKDVIEETARDGDQDVVKSSVTYTLGNYLEVLTLTGTKVINGTGNELDNTITGNDAANILTGDAGDDVINAGAGDDMIDGGEGDDDIDGGDGHDTVVYQSTQDNYDISSDDEGKWTVEYIGGESEDGTDVGVNEGSDSIVNVEILSFSDVDMTLEGPLGTLTVQFDEPEFVVSEGSTLSLMITLSEASDQDVTVNYIVEDWNTDSTDYEVSPQDSITFAAGDIAGYIDIIATDDGVPEVYEDFTITITDADGAEIGGMNIAVIGINDMI